MNAVIDAIIGLTNMANEQRTGETPEPSDEDLTKQFLLQNKVSEQCTNELIQYRGVTSLYALALAVPEDVQDPEIPTGQQRLILHLVKVLKSQSEDKSADKTGAPKQTPLQNTDPGLTPQSSTAQQPALQHPTLPPHQGGCTNGTN